MGQKRSAGPSSPPTSLASNAKAAKRLLRKLLKKQGIAPRVMITDRLASYGAAKRAVMPGVEHRQHKELNNRRRTVISRPDGGSGS
jgi:transposase-like protein